MERAVADFCAAGPALAILDNFETPWRKDESATEALLDRLAAVSGLRLIITICGESPVVHADSVVLPDIEQLGDKDARQLFMRHAGRDFSVDPDSPELMRGLDGHPLSIELLAASAKGHASLASVAADWRARSASKVAVRQRRSQADQPVLDDWGLTALSTQDRADLLEILDDRVNAGATLITSQ